MTRLLLPVLVLALIVFLVSRLGWQIGAPLLLLVVVFFFWRNRHSIHLNKAQEASNRGDIKAAVNHIEQAVRANRKNPAVMASYAYLLLKDGQIDKADEAIDKARKLDTGDKLKANTRITGALIRWKQGKLDEAIAMLEELQSEMQNTQLYGSLGYLYLEKGDLDKALAYNKEAFEYNDTDGVILDNLATTHILRGEWEEASETIDRLMEQSPKFPEAYYHRALVKEHNGDLEGALEDCERALEKRFSAVSTERKETIKAKRDELMDRLGKTREDD